MSDQARRDALTRLIVGPARTLELGVPAAWCGQQPGQAHLTSLDWAHDEAPVQVDFPVGEPATKTQFVPHELVASTAPSIAAAAAPDPTESKGTSNPPFRRRAGSRAVPAAAAIGLLALAAGLLTLRGQPEPPSKPVVHAATAAAAAPAPPSGLPVPPAPQESSVTVVDEPYAAEAAASDVPLPIAPKEAIEAVSRTIAKAAPTDGEKRTGEAPARRREPPPPPTVKPTPPVPTPPKQAAGSQPEAESKVAPRVAAVVLDEVAPAKPLAQPPKPVAPAPAAAPAPASTPPKQSPLARGSGLIAITPDGKTAVFTNPTNRMPEQFRIGDKLPGGETVKAIDAVQGKVITTSKEYGLD